MNRGGRQSDRRIALGVMAFALLYLLAAWNLPRFRLTTVVDAHLFPLAVGIALFFLSAALWVQSGRRESTSPSEEKPARWRGLHIPGGVMLAVLSLAYILVLERLGFLVATFAFLLLAPAVFGWRRWLTSGSVALAFSAGTYYLFDRILMISLPRGILPF